MFFGDFFGDMFFMSYHEEASEITKRSPRVSESAIILGTLGFLLSMINYDELDK